MDLNKLQEREKKIIRCVAAGMTNIEIGEELGYSSSTVKKFLTRLYKKLNIKNRIELVKLLLC